MLIDRSFFQRDTLLAARELIGHKLFCRTSEGEACGIIVETEAYLGQKDDAAHSYRGRTERVRALYGEKGCAYIYLIYGLHLCLNISSGADGVPECILIRALEPVSGIELMEKRRNTDKLRNLCSGPGKLCAALGLKKEHYGADMCDRASGLFIETGEKLETAAFKRIGVDYAEKCRDELWRFAAVGNEFVSK